MDLGVITGRAFDPTTGTNPAFVATRCHDLKETGSSAQSRNRYIT